MCPHLSLLGLRIGRATAARKPGANKASAQKHPRCGRAGGLEAGAGESLGAAEGLPPPGQREEQRSLSCLLLAGSQPGHHSAGRPAEARRSWRTSAALKRARQRKPGGASDHHPLYGGCAPAPYAAVAAGQVSGCHGTTEPSGGGRASAALLHAARALPNRQLAAPLR